MKDKFHSEVIKIKYVGSKSRIAKFIVPIIQEYIESNKIETYIEPFCGGCNVIDKIKCKSKIASDKNEYLIHMFKNITKIQELPEELSKEYYSECREQYKKGNFEIEKWIIGSIGFLGSYNAKFYGGYAGTVVTKTGVTRNYYQESKRNLINQIPYLNDITFDCCDYTNYTNYKGCLFYLDIPYRDTTKYITSLNFDYDLFWNWCRELSKNNIVLISEHTAPNDFECIWQHSVKRTMDNASRNYVVERLFKYNKI